MAVSPHELNNGAMRLLKKIFRILLIAAVVLVVGFGVLFLVFNEARPEGRPGPEAEAMAQRMLDAVNARAWDQVQLLQWSFPRGHDFVWDVQDNVVQVKWKDRRVLVDPTRGKAIAYEDGQRVSGERAEELREKATHYFWNDSFWLMAFTKVMDPGTVREVVDLGEGKQGLLVTYQSGGSTPGDSYLWKLDESGKPYAWKMWVKIIPIGGIEFTWEDWKALPGGAWIATSHKNPLFDVDLTNVKTGNRPQDLGLPNDLFDELKQMP